MERQGLLSSLTQKPRLPKPVMVPGASAQRILREDRDKVSPF